MHGIIQCSATAPARSAAIRAAADWLRRVAKPSTRSATSARVKSSFVPTSSSKLASFARSTHRACQGAGSVGAFLFRSKSKHDTDFTDATDFWSELVCRLTWIFVIYPCYPFHPWDPCHVLIFRRKQ